MIIAKNITKTFTTKENRANCVLNNVSLSIEAGKITALLGKSGAGKSTLLYLLGALDTPNNGEITLILNEPKTGNPLSYNYSKMTQAELSTIRNKHIGFVFQFHHLLPEFNVLENIMIPSMIAGVSSVEAKTKALELMEKIDIIHIQKQHPNEISGGEAQRVAIARSLINTPGIVLADEPTGNLDTANAKNIMQLISSLNIDLGITFLIATHSLEMANISNNIIKMHDGAVTSIEQQK